MKKLLLFLSVLFPEQVCGDTAPAQDDRTLWAIVCATPEEAFAAVYDVSEGNGINGRCKRLTIARGLRETAQIVSPYRAVFYDFGAKTALEIR